MPNTIKCPNCNTDNLEGANQCYVCNYNFAKPQTDDSNTIKCPQCGTENYDIASRCFNCNNKLNSPQTHSAYIDTNVKSIEIICTILGYIQIFGGLIITIIFSASLDMPFTISAITAITIALGSVFYFGIAYIIKYLRQQSEYIKLLHNKIDSLIEKQK